MSAVERVTVTLPKELVRSIDHFERNRSRFIAEAVKHELQRRHREGLRRSLRTPHPESSELADVGLSDWADNLPDEEGEALVDSTAGKSVRWISGKGWIEGAKK